VLFRSTMTVLKGSILLLQIYQSLVLDPGASLLKDNKNSDYSKTNILSTLRINKIYFAIKVFNYLYEGFKTSV
jgi:hypothetical protein